MVAWTSEEYLADTRARKHGAYWMWGNPASEASVGLVTAASAQSAIDAEKARADRLAKALERQASNMAFVLNHANIGTWFDKFTTELSEDRAALQQEG